MNTLEDWTLCRCLSCPWQGYASALSANACPQCDGRVTDAPDFPISRAVEALGLSRKELPVSHDTLDRAAQRILEAAHDFRQATREATTVIELENLVNVMTSACLTLTTQLEQSAIALKWKQQKEAERRG